MDHFINNFERVGSYKKAQELWTEVVSKYSLKCLKKNYSLNGFTTSLCYLTNNHCYTVRGAGKGSNILAIDTSAQFEALEFYLSSYYMCRYHVIYGLPDDIATQYNLILDRCNSEVFQTEVKKQQTPLPWVIYKNITSSKQYAILLPAVDVSYCSNWSEKPSFNYQNCQLYSSSNGLSSGATYEESVIHGTLELLERDAYSYFLVDTYILNKEPLIINPEILPGYLLDLVMQIEKNLKIP